MRMLPPPSSVPLSTTVVRQRPRPLGRAVEQRHVVGHRRRERMVHGAERAGHGVALEHRKIDHPQETRVRTPESRSGDARPPGERDRAPGWRRGPVRRRTARARPRRARAAGPRSAARNFADRPIERAVHELEPQQSGGSRLLRLASISSTCFRDNAAPPGTRMPRTRPPASSAAVAMPKSDAAKHVARVEDLEAVAQVGPVRAVALHRVGVRHPREASRGSLSPPRATARRRALRPGAGCPPRCDERRLDVDLRELGLTVRAQILVAEAARDLEVAVEPRDHEQLLVELRRLRQRVELARVHAARHQVVARALRASAS